MSALAVPVAFTRSRAIRRVYVAPQRNQVLAALYQAPERQATARAIGSTPQYMDSLENPDVGAALVKRVGFVPSGPKGGRPAVLWTLTDAGVKRIRRALGETK